MPDTPSAARDQPGRPPNARSAWIAAAHPRDADMACGGTIELLRAAGCTITHAAAMPARYGEAMVGAIVDALRAAQADLLIAPSPLEPDPARRAWGMACVEAARRVGAPLRLALYEIDRPGRADHRVDVSATAAARAAGDPAARALARFRARGLPGAELAEAFELWPAERLTAGLPTLYANEHQRHVERGEAVDGARDLPLVSVLVRSMQRDSVAAALDSVARQTWPNVEVVLINARGGGHPDPGPHCGPFELRLVNAGGPRLDRPQAANAGLTHARGDWLLFLDDDDLLDPDHLARLRAALDADPQARVAYTGVRLIGADGQPTGVLDEPFDDSRLWLANFLPIHAVMFSREVLADGVRFDETLPVYEDWDFWCQLSQRWRFVHVPGVSASYRLVGDSGLSRRADERVAGAGRERFYGKWLPRLRAAELDRIALAGERHRIAARELAERSARADRDIESLLAQLAGLNGQLAEARAAGQAVSQQAAALAESLAARAAQLEAERIAHQALRAELQRREQDHAAALAAAAAERERVERELTAVAATEREAHDATRAALAATHADYQRLERGYREVTSSASWRLTEPLRRLRASAGQGIARQLLRGLWRALPLPAAARGRIRATLAASPLGQRLLRRLAAPAVPAAAATGPGAAPGAVGPATPAAPTAPPLDKEAVRAQAEAELGHFLAGPGRIRLPAGDAQPQVSVIVVLYNQAGLSLLCLQALQASRGVSLQTLIVDNASTDRVGALLERVDGAQVLRQADNLGFLRAVNLAAAQARGRYLLLLNNDALVEPDTVAAAAARLDREADVAAVGGPIRLWDGSLQEAGSIIWRDGSCQGYGRGDSPDRAAYRFVRDVDYCSGAFLMIRRDAFERLGRFDEAYAPAYYEESDLCVRLWKAGHRVVYDPRVRIRHFEFASDAGSDRAMALQARNREIFVARHRDYLARRPERSERALVDARQILRPGRPRVLIVDDRIPYPALGRGYPRASMLARAIADRAAALCYYPLVFADGDWNTVHDALDERTEIILDQGAAGLGDFLAERASTFDLILVSRPHNMQVVQALRRRNPSWFEGRRLVYDAEALFSLREIEKARVLGTPLPDSKARALLDGELALADGADRIVAVSEDEAGHYRRHGGADVVVLGHALVPQPSPPPFEARRGFLFVGAITEDGCPNGDSLLWFVREVWPTLRAQLGDDAVLDVVGVCESPALNALADASIRLCGRVERLEPYFDARRVFIVPTRFAAGVPHKAHEAASRGLPMVTSALIRRQLGWHDELLVGADAAGFAQACLRLHGDRALWQRLREGLLAAVERDCSRSAFDAAVARIVA